MAAATTLPAGLLGDPFTTSLPTGGGGGLTLANADTRARKPRRVDPDAQVGNQQRSEWTIRIDVVVPQWKTLGYEKKIEMGDLLFKMLPAVRVGHVSSKGVTVCVLNLQCFNDLARRSWVNIKARLQSLLALDDRTLAVKGDEGNRLTRYRKFLRLPESQWKELYDTTSRLREKSDASALLDWLHLDGLMNAYAPIGFCETEPATAVPNSTYGMPGADKIIVSRSNITLMVKGTMDVRNPWGAAALPNAYLFLVFKRIFDKNSGEYTHFIAEPVASMSEDFSTEKGNYNGTAGYPQLGAVWLMGRVLKILTGQESEFLIPSLANIEGDLDHNLALLRRKAKLRILCFVPRRVI